MAYTPTTWATGDTITATAMNKIEQGIANADRTAIVTLNAIGMSASSHLYGHIVYAHYDNGIWIVQNDNGESWIEVFGYTAPYDKFILVSIPPDDTYGVFFLLETVAETNTMTGGVSPSATTLYFSYGSRLSLDAYRITGSGSIEWNDN